MQQKINISMFISKPITFLRNIKNKVKKMCDTLLQHTPLPPGINGGNPPAIICSPSEIISGHKLLSDMLR